jgi:hypothetical protein
MIGTAIAVGEQDREVIWALLIITAKYEIILSNNKQFYFNFNLYIKIS